MHLSAWSQRRPSACARGVVLASAVAFGAVAGCGVEGGDDARGGAGDRALNAGKSSVSVGGSSGSPAAGGNGTTSGCTTTLSGVVSTPAGSLPLYNVML